MSETSIEFRRRVEPVGYCETCADLDFYASNMKKWRETQFFDILSFS